MSTSPRVPPATMARVVEWTRHQLYRLNQRLVPAPAAMMEMIIATWTSQAITVAAQLGVADALAAGPLTIDELAARVDADTDALRRLLRALIGRGVFRQRRDGRFELNSLADTLRSDAPVSMKLRRAVLWFAGAARTLDTAGGFGENRDFGRSGTTR